MSYEVLIFGFVIWVIYSRLKPAIKAQTGDAPDMGDILKGIRGVIDQREAAEATPADAVSWDKKAPAKPKKKRGAQSTRDLLKQYGGE